MSDDDEALLNFDPFAPTAAPNPNNFNCGFDNAEIVIDLSTPSSNFGGDSTSNTPLKKRPRVKKQKPVAANEHIVEHTAKSERGLGKFCEEQLYDALNEKKNKDKGPSSVTKDRPILVGNTAELNIAKPPPVKRKRNMETKVEGQSSVVKCCSVQPTLEEQTFDARDEHKKKNDGTSPVNIERPILVGNTAELNMAKPPPVKRKRKTETKVDGQSSVAKSCSVQQTPNHLEQEETKRPRSDTEVKKKSKLTFQDKVLREMFAACKPFNISALYKQTNSTSEAALEFALISLLDKKLILKKEFVSSKGTSKTLYWANLEMANHKDAAQAIRVQYSEDDMTVALEQYKQISDQHIQIQRNIETLLKEVTNEELDNNLKQMENEIGFISERIQKAKDFKDKIQSKKASNTKHCPRLIKLRINHYREEWKRRKEKTMIFVENFADATEKKVKDVLKLLEIETDEMVGVKLPPKHLAVITKK